MNKTLTSTETSRAFTGCAIIRNGDLNGLHTVPAELGDRTEKFIKNLALIDFSRKAEAEFAPHGEGSIDDSDLDSDSRQG